MKRSVLFLFSVLALAAAKAEIKLPALIGNNMVLQQQSRVALWGWADAGEKITITASWNKKATSVMAGADGKWITWVNTAKAGGPYTIMFKGSNEIKIENVLLGEVWLTAGQSNMEFFVGRRPGNGSYTGVLNYEQEIKEGSYPNIRLIDVANKVADEPQTDFKGQWDICSPKVIDSFSAVAYYFAREIHRKTGFSVGIINSSWGGTPAESWTKKEVLAADKGLNEILLRYNRYVAEYPEAVKEYRQKLAAWKQDTSKKKERAPQEPMGPGHNKSPYKLYNGMIAPLVPFTLKGVLWYQGESNAGLAWQYRTLFPAMIASWRADFKNEKLPFYFVQISPHRGQNPEIREAQLYTMQTVPFTGMVVTTDNGDSLDIHPRNKKLVGERLSLWALHNEYGHKQLVYTGPIYKSSVVEGESIRIRFEGSNSELVAKDGQPLTEFTIAGDDQQFVPAKAVIDGNTIVVSSDAVKKPVAVRFAWSNVPRPNLFNKAGLPASPFRTDHWQVATQGKN